MKKKILKYILMAVVCFTFMFCFMPNISCAATGDWTYDVNAETLTNSEDDTLVIRNVTASGNELSIGKNDGATFTNLDLTGKIADINGNEYLITSIESKAFFQCASLKTITFPDTLVSIGASAFEECIALEEITIPESVVSMDGGVFNRCRSLEKVTIFGKITSIETGLFANCSSLKEITLPDTLQAIGLNSFYLCSPLETIYLNSEIPPTVNVTAFQYCHNINRIYVPYGSLESYKNAQVWMGYADYITFEKKNLTVVKGTGSGSYGIGQSVTVKADDNDENGHFLKWSSDSSQISFKDENAKETSFTMPQNDVVVTAVFEEHEYVNGKCSVCGYDNSNYNIQNDDDKNNESVKSEGKSDNISTDKPSSSVDTSDENNMVYYIICVLVSVVGIAGLSIYKYKKVR